MTCHCSGVGSKANWNACSVQPFGAAYLRGSPRGWPGDPIGTRPGAPHRSSLRWGPLDGEPPRGAPLRAIVLERCHRPLHAMGGRAPAVEPDAEAGQDLGHVSDQVIVCSTTMVVTVG